MSTLVTGPTGKLTANQRRFAEEYVIDRNATRAYLRAFGPTTRAGVRRTYRGARVAAARLMANDNVRAEIDAAGREMSRRCRVSAVRTLREIAAIAFADPGDCFAGDPTNHGLPAPKAWADIPAAARRTIASVKMKRRRLVTKEKDADGKPVLEAWEVEDLEYRFHSKMDALDKLCRHLGLTKDGAGLEKLLELLSRPAEAAA